MFSIVVVDSEQFCLWIHCAFQYIIGIDCIDEGSYAAGIQKKHHERQKIIKAVFTGQIAYKKGLNDSKFNDDTKKSVFCTDAIIGTNR